MRRRAASETEAAAPLVPLPHGTEVVTRVARRAGQRDVPAGSVGRVMKLAEDGVHVSVVGVGTLLYAREELAPRRSGQEVFAVRRELAWQALAPCLVLETRVGSHAWNLADEHSDEDLRGAFALPFPWSCGLGKAPEDLTSADSTKSYWSVEKSIRQALRADPNTLEMLFVPGARALDPIGEWLLAERSCFVSREIYGSFARYALAQLKRLEQAQRLHGHRDLLIEWLKRDPELSLDDAAVRLAQVSPRASVTPNEAVLEAKQWIKQLYRSLYDQGLLPANDFESLRARSRTGELELERSRELRPKNAYNLLRLIRTARDWLEQGEPSFAATGSFRERLLAIKRGQVPLTEVLSEAEAMTFELEAVRGASRLPERADIGAADSLLRRIQEELARRYVAEVPGPFGKDATLPPLAEWQP